MLGLLLALLPLATHAQQAMEPFGKNRIQYKTFKWQYISSANFDIYYYDNNQPLAVLAAQHAEAEFSRIGELLGFSPYNKIKLYIYATKADLLQSNVGLDEANDIIGGKTSFFKSIIEVPFPGTQQGFRQEISLGIARTMLYDMMFGGTFKEVVQNAYLLNLPDWFLGGAAYYAAYGWSMEMDDFIREAVLRRRLRKPTTLAGEDARLAGQSLWNYIAERHGRNNISSILNLTRVMRSEEASVATTLGTSFDRLLADWKEWYQTQAEQTTANYVLPDKKNRLGDRNTRRYTINAIKFSKDGRYLAYTLNQNGRCKVVVQDMQTGKERVVHRSGQRVFNQRADEEMPIVAWQNNSLLHVIFTKHGKPWHEMINLAGNGGGFARPMATVNEVNDFDVHPDGRMLVLSATVNGQNDLYFYYHTSGRAVAVTNDIFDDANPRFLPDGSRMVFSSNRSSDTLNPRVKPLIGSVQPFYQLYLIDPVAERKTARRLTAGLSNHEQAQPVGDNQLVFLTDESGIANLRQLDLATGQSIELTNYRQSITSFGMRPGGQVAFAIALQSRRNLFLEPLADTVHGVTNIPTRRMLIMNGGALPLPVTNGTAPANPADSAEKTSPTPVPTPIEYNPVPASLRPDTSQGEIDIRHYVFESEKLPRQPQPKKAPIVRPAPGSDGGSVLSRRGDRPGTSTGTAGSVLSRKPGVNLLGDRLEFVGPFPYRNRLGMNNVVTSFQVDPLLGTGALLQSSLTDMFENHKIRASILGIVDLRSSNMGLEYEYLKHRVDFHARYAKRSLFYAGSDDNERYQRLNIERFEAGASYPFSIFSRLSFTPIYARTKSVLLYDNASQIAALNQNDIIVHYGGWRTELVFDNTRSHGMNLLEGSRAKIKMETMLGGGGRNFTQINVDARHYQNLGRELTLALRGSAGTFVGPGKKMYVLGGMDNWLFNTFKKSDLPDDPFNGNVPQPAEGRTDWLFNQFVTNMRGFAYNAMYGHSYMLGNAELRFPIVRYFYRGPISSNFFRNLMLTTFVDAGTAWTQGNPIDGLRGINERVVVDNNQFNIRVKEYKSPFLIGYGAGVRTMLLGYYAKLDVAQGIQDGKRNENLRFYITLGFDF